MKSAEIDRYIAKSPAYAKPILEHIRALVHRVLPETEEAMKWSRPHFMLGGKNVAGMSAFKAHCAFMIHGDGRQGEGMGSFGKIAALADLPPVKELEKRLLAARDRIAEGGSAMRRAPSKPKAPLAVPQDFAAALKANKRANAYFDAFSPSAQREYVEWVTEAKQDATRERRLKQSVEWIAEGKRRNWKYEKC